MKNLTLLTILFLAVSFAGHGNAIPERISTDRVTPVQTHDIRLGLITTSGTPTLSGSYDLAGFYAMNVETGEYYYSYPNRVNGFLKLPAFIYDLPEGTYEFGAFQGQGGWMAVSPKTVTIGSGMDDESGYITLYLDIAWEE
ncbi:hypothetical protein ED312_05785 [Sinomicrobium pectinilyticum]|uniref:DUF2141 domain-containing protein n=1 Tax=Sinomicrobium pectinilyticum TaxID=1084421 RepID=A0A3N0ESD7_SINP1|nr:hypothetical protein [Sinomicrobium pectinilyticum]RNL90687.1 hypothetical protein ED312_05785 [Sinomicrobium pectinilyticum]